MNEKDNTLSFGMLSSKEIHKKAQYVKQIKASDLAEARKAPVGSSVP